MLKIKLLLISKVRASSQFQMLVQVHTYLKGTKRDHPNQKKLTKKMHTLTATNKEEDNYTLIHWSQTKRRKTIMIETPFQYEWRGGNSSKNQLYDITSQMKVLACFYMDNVLQSELSNQSVWEETVHVGLEIFRVHDICNHLRVYWTNSKASHIFYFILLSVGARFISQIVTSDQKEKLHDGVRLVVRPQKNGATTVEQIWTRVESRRMEKTTLSS